MSLPAALTWAYLFPEETSFICASGPDWLRSLIAPHAEGGEARVLTAWRQDRRSLPDPERWDGIVAFNCVDFSARVLEEAGFPYVRRFAALPSAAEARWFIPLDCSGRAAAAAFDIYTPARRSARAKLALAKAAVHARLPGWYHDTVVVASRRPPELEEVLASLFPGRALRLGISAGAPEPARNRKASAAVVDASTGTILAFVKIGASELSRQLLRREAAALSALAGLAARAPRLIHAGAVAGRFVTVQEPLAGRPAAAALTPQHREFLQALRGPAKTAAATGMIKSLAARIDALDRHRSRLAAALAAVMPALESFAIPATIVHGDFAPWNLRRRAGRICAFDWEYAELDGLPLIDETHFEVQLRYHLDGWNAARFHAHLTALAAARPLGLVPDQIGAIHRVYALDSVVRLLGEGYPLENDLLRWYAQVLARLLGHGWRLSDGSGAAGKPA